MGQTTYWTLSRTNIGLHRNLMGQTLVLINISWDKYWLDKHWLGQTLSGKTIGQTNIEWDKTIAGQTSCGTNIKLDKHKVGQNSN